jgi:hypothetical protein
MWPQTPVPQARATLFPAVFAAVLAVRAALAVRTVQAAIALRAASIAAARQARVIKGRVWLKANWGRLGSESFPLRFPSNLDERVIECAVGAGLSHVFGPTKPV